MTEIHEHCTIRSPATSFACSSAIAAPRLGRRRAASRRGGGVDGIEYLGTQDTSADLRHRRRSAIGGVVMLRRFALIMAGVALVGSTSGCAVVARSSQPPAAVESSVAVNNAKPAVSGDGRYVAFTSPAANLVPNDTNATDDVFLRDRVSGSTERVSVATGGVQ